MSRKNSNIENLYKSRNTLLKTLEYRGFKIPSGVKNLSFQDFEVLYKKNRHHIYFPTIHIPKKTELEKKENRNGGIYIFFEPSEDFTKKILEARVAAIIQEYKNLERLFFALKSNTKKKINAFVTNALKSDKYSFVKTLPVLTFDITENYLVSEMRPLSEQEKKALMKIRPDINKFPKIFDTDPMVKLFGGSAGDIMYIKNEGGNSLSYRIVVNSNNSDNFITNNKSNNKSSNNNKNNL